MRNPFATLTPRYSPLSSKPPSPSSPLNNPSVLLSILIVAISSFYLGRHTAPSDSLLTVPLKTTTRTFHYDPLFGSAPSNATNAAWHSLFPAQGGFFKHPTLAPSRSAFAVFHQLHCLDSLRKTHALLLSGVPETELPPMHQAPHTRHCIDLIRQGLMCRPDTTVEIKDEEKGGVTGFGTEHVCWEWEELVRWVRGWEGWGGEESV